MGPSRSRPGAINIVKEFNLNTHTPASLYEAVESNETKRLADKLEIHHTPKQGA